MNSKVLYLFAFQDLANAVHTLLFDVRRVQVKLIPPPQAGNRDDHIRSLVACNKQRELNLDALFEYSVLWKGKPKFPSAVIARDDALISEIGLRSYAARSEEE